MVYRCGGAVGFVGWNGVRAPTHHTRTMRARSRERRVRGRFLPLPRRRTPLAACREGRGRPSCSVRPRAPTCGHGARGALRARRPSEQRPPPPPLAPAVALAPQGKPRHRRHRAHATLPERPQRLDAPSPRPGVGTVARRRKRPSRGPWRTPTRRTAMLPRPPLSRGEGRTTPAVPEFPTPCRHPQRVIAAAFLRRGRGGPVAAKGEARRWSLGA